MRRDRTWRRYLPFAQWPDGDVQAWNQAIREGDILDGRGPAWHWAEATRACNIEHYSRWLGWLRHEGSLDCDCSPETRVTRPTIKSYVEHLRNDVAPRTVVSALVGLKVMLKAMAPDQDWRWLADVCNALNRSSKPQTQKARRMRSTAEIYAAAIAELDRLLMTPLTRRIERVAFRDALMLAFLTARPLRRKNFTNLELGRQFKRVGSIWMIDIPSEETKNGSPLEHSLPMHLNPYLDVYLARVRPSFHGKASSRWLWLTFEGDRLVDHSIYCRFALTTRRLLGVAINPHLLRDCAATSLSTDSPAAALAATPLLGHRSRATTERYYVRANQLEAGRRVNAVLDEIKKARN